MKNFFKLFIPVLILLAGVGSILFFELYLKDHVNTVPVIVATKDIDFKGKFDSKENIAIKNVPRDNLVDKAFVANSKDDLRKLDGKFAAIEIRKGAQIYPEMVDTYNLVPDTTKGEFIAPLPKEWIFAVPGSLRRSYIADIFAVPVQDYSRQAELINSTSSVDTLVQNAPSVSKEPILTNVRVAFTKDNSNKEVKKPEKAESPYDATGQISDVEIIATKEDLAKIRQFTDSGMKLLIVYRYDIKQ